MSYVLKTIYNTEVVIDDNCGVSKFFAIANLLKSEFNIEFDKKEENANNVDWNFNYKQQPLTLHFDIYGGISIKTAQNNAKNCYVGKELGDYLHSKWY
jgi:hypothetical protein